MSSRAVGEREVKLPTVFNAEAIYDLTNIEERKGFTGFSKYRIKRVDLRSEGVAEDGFSAGDSH